jgi:uncharacterized protein (DUF1697 family)
MQYVAFLRGINVGGHRPVKMAELRAVFEGSGFAGVRTVQASGNVVFQAADDDVEAVALRVEEALEQAFGSGGAARARPANHFRAGVIVRPLSDLQRLVAAEPFAGVPIEPATRLYVTFLSPPVKSGTGIGPGRSSVQSGPPAHPKVSLVEIREGEVLTAITLEADWGTTDLMAWLEKEFGPAVTTRNWSTILKTVTG